jgi:hypothetical protein
MQEVKIDDCHSLVDMRTYAMDFSHFRDFNEYVDDVKMTADFRNAKLSFTTIGFFAFNFHVDDLTLFLNGVVSGPVSDLQSNHLVITLPNRPTRIATSFRMAGLPDIDETSLCLDVEDLQTNAGDLAHILRNFIKHNYKPGTDRLIQTLGDIHYQGSFTGLYNDFVICGIANTSVGSAQLDMLFHPTEQHSFTVEGKTTLKKFNLGNLIHQKILGEMDAEAMATMVFNPASGEEFKFKLNGEASNFNFNQYAYSGITIDGELSNCYFDGLLNCNDPNLSMNFDGYIAFGDNNDSTFVLRHNYRANIQHADLATLKFNMRDTISELKAKVMANYQYSGSFDTGTGRIEVTDVFYHDPSGVHNLSTLTLLSSHDDNVFRSQLRASFADADFRGNSSFFQFLNDVSYAGYGKHLPFFNRRSAPHSTGRASDYEFDVRIKKTGGIAYLLHPELYIAENTQLMVHLMPDDRLTATFSSPMLALGNEWIRNVDIKAENLGKKMDVALNIDASEFFSLPIHKIAGHIEYADNNVNTTLSYNNNSKPSNKGQLRFNTGFNQLENKEHPFIDVKVLPSEIVLNDTLWNISPAHLTIDGDIIACNKLQISNQHQQIAVHGTISHAASDTFFVQLKHYDMANFNGLTSKKGYNLKGTLSGEAKFTGIYDTLISYVNFEGQQLAANGHPLGNLSLQSNWDKGKKLFQLLAEINENGTKTFMLNGTYIPKSNILDIASTFNHFKTVHVEPLLDKVLTNINGYLSGDFKLKGSLKEPVFYGTNVVLDSLGLTVDYLQTHYLLTLPVEITPTTISIQNALVRDGTGGTGTLNGTLQHRHFRNIKYDLQVQTNNMLCLNTTLKSNNAFYGKAYGTGLVRIKGDDDRINFNITANTEANSIVHIPLSNNSYQAKESGLLTFVAPVKDEANEWHPRTTSIMKSGQRTTFNISLNATPSAEVQIIFDQKAGDIIRARGSGNINLNIDPAMDKFDIFGDYSIEQGDYFFTLQNIISKKFIMEQGSRIAFNGDINKTTLDITGLYKTKASLSTLTDDTSSVNQVRRNIDCKIFILGNLFAPVLSYDIEVQNLDPSTRARVQSALNTEEKKTRQFLSLLAFNSFMPEQQSGISSVNLTTSTSELLSNQLSNMLAQLNIPFDLGFVYNSTEQGNSAFDVAVSTQLFDNRVAINGTFGNGKTNTAENTFTGDLDIELKFDQQGRFRGKAFTHSADQFTDQFDNSQRSGVGFIYQEDFNTFKELFDRWFGKKKKKEEEKPDETGVEQP